MWGELFPPRGLWYIAAVSGNGSIAELLRRGRERDTALTAPGRQSLTYGELRRQVARNVEHFGRLGIGRGSRVAIVSPNGPEMAVAFLTVAVCSTAAPLNPAYKLDEFLFYLEDLRADALLIARGLESPAREAAARLGVAVVEFAPDGEPAGTFALHANGRLDRGRAPLVHEIAEDAALLLHTSGTTSRPKLVPLSERNLSASARNVAAVLALTPDDVCLNVMPLFHIHGLVGALLSSLAAGGAVACAPGFNAFRFFAWMEEARPTWYSAVPSIHQAIVQRAAANAATVRAARLRLVRSSSSALPPRLMADLEALFGVPAIESYGMTEAAHQMTSNPLPPLERKAGSVGVAAGPDVAVMDGAGNLLGAGQVGEIVIRGENVMRGYLDNPEVNAQCFSSGWFRTGDQGVIDTGGYLAVTGRLKEIINRGGEKVSPREVDEVLLDHPAVAQAVTFALPHDMLGEEVAVAIVLRDGNAAAAHELRSFAAERLADFKVPRKVLILDRIPTGPTGKPQRIGMARRLGLVS